jgi:hypothetical protein
VFNWIVCAINAKLDMGKKGSGRFIAILDIYGFEQFQVNRWVCSSPSPQQAVSNSRVVWAEFLWRCL